MKIIDCFTFYNELSILDFRLKELYDVVDYFILVECTKTFANNDKELFFENNKNKYSKYLDKIIHIIIDKDIPQTPNSWDRERYQRNCIDNGIKQLNLNDNDIIIISDADEIPDANTLLLIKNGNLHIEDVCDLEQDLYYYNLNCKFERKWNYAKILNYKQYNYINKPEEIRSLNLNQPKIKNGGWHFSYFGDVEFIKNKIKNFSHQEYNNDIILNDERIKDRIDKSIDLYDRKNETFKYIPIEQNNYLPKNYRDLL